MRSYRHSQAGPKFIRIPDRIWFPESSCKGMGHKGKRVAFEVCVLHSDKEQGKIRRASSLFGRFWSCQIPHEICHPGIQKWLMPHARDWLFHWFEVVWLVRQAGSVPPVCGLPDGPDRELNTRPDQEPNPEIPGLNGFHVSRVIIRVHLWFSFATGACIVPLPRKRNHLSCRTNAKLSMTGQK